MDEETCYRKLEISRARYEEFIKESRRRPAVPVQAATIDPVALATLRHVTISCHDKLSLHIPEEPILRLATIREFKPFHLKAKRK